MSNHLNRIKERLKNKKAKGITIVKEEQIKSYCREFNLNFDDSVASLKACGTLVKYNRSQKRFPYRYGGN